MTVFTVRPLVDTRGSDLSHPVRDASVGRKYVAKIDIRIPWECVLILCCGCIPTGCNLDLRGMLFLPSDAFLRIARRRVAPRGHRIVVAPRGRSIIVAPRGQNNGSQG